LGLGKKKSTRKTNWIMTYSGTHFDLLNPTKEQIKLEDIAHALSQECRFSGHTKFFYSVAQHCLLGAYKMLEDGLSDRLQLLFMLHDATETWYRDIPRPLKPLLPEYLKLEARCEKVVWEAFGIKEPTEEEWEIVKRYDNLMLGNEILKLMPNPNEFENVEIRDDGIEIKEYRIGEVEELFKEVVIMLLTKVKANEKQAVHN
jgi:hypothetical protein